MNLYQLSDTAIAAELGQRLERLRLERNITQKNLADEIGITPKSYRQMIAGGGKLENFIAALRALNELQQVDMLLPASGFSPLAQLKLRGKQRQRARPSSDDQGVREPRLDW